MGVSIQFKMENDAFKHGNAAAAAADIVRACASTIADGNVHDGINEKIFDVNGNSIGTFSVDYEVDSGLRCPKCKSDDFDHQEDETYVCCDCGERFNSDD